MMRPTSNNQTETLVGDLEDNSDNVDNAASNDCPFNCDDMSVLSANKDFAAGKYSRPMISATSPAMMAPKKVPAERMEVIRDRWEPERAQSAGSVPGGGGPSMSSMNVSEPVTPLM